MEIDWTKVVEVANGLGLSGTVGVLVTYLRRRLSIEGRQARLSKRLTALSSTELSDLVQKDPLLKSVLHEERSSTVFESLTGLRAHGPLRNLLIRFIAEKRGKYTFPDLQSLEALGRWDGDHFVALASKIDKGLNWLFRYASFGLILLGVVLMAAVGILGMPRGYVMSALLIEATGFVSLAYFVRERRKQDLGSDLAAFSRRMEESAQSAEVSDSSTVLPPGAGTD
jgi:Flp pilus assembly protein TadB